MGVTGHRPSGDAVPSARPTRRPADGPAGATAVMVVLRDERLELADVLSRAVAAGAGDVVIDLAGVDVIETAEFFTLAAAARLLESDGRRLTLRWPSKLATRVLNLFGLTDLIDARD